MLSLITYFLGLRVSSALILSDLGNIPKLPHLENRNENACHAWLALEGCCENRIRALWLKLVLNSEGSEIVALLVS